MAYRAHIVVLDPERHPQTPVRLGTFALKALKAPDSTGVIRGLGYVGTRYGNPGFWVEADRKDTFVLAVARLVGKVTDFGFLVRVYATNETSLKAAHELGLKGRNKNVLTVTRG